jgi:hypothetical protein
MMKNTTDYVFPEDWGLRTPEQKDAWFKEERAFRQMMRQYEAGMYDQWDEERLEGGITLGEALAKADRNEFKKK